MPGGMIEISHPLALMRPLWRIVLICLLAALLLRMVRRLLIAFGQRVSTRLDGHHDGRRLETLINVVRYTATVAIVSVAGMLVLGALGITIAPLLATAGVAGIAIGFGAQSLVKDFFTGLFLLLENQVSEGDNIEAAGKNGIVEQVTLRHIRLRDYDGSVHFIPNSLINVVTNRSRGYTYAVIDLTVARSHDFASLVGALRAADQELRHDPALAPLILGELDVAGIEKLEEASITVRCRIKVAPAQQWRVRRAFLQHMQDRIGPPA
jgi:small conductance mechanosensitive channel